MDDTIDDIYYDPVDNVTGKITQIADMYMANWAFDLTR